MIGPLVSRIWHGIRAHADADQRERGMKAGEVYGFRPAVLIQLLERHGFLFHATHRFMLGFNRICVFRLVQSKNG